MKQDYKAKQDKAGYDKIKQFLFDTVTLPPCLLLCRTQGAYCALNKEQKRGR